MDGLYMLPSHSQFITEHPHPTLQNWLEAYPIHNVIAVSKTFDLVDIAKVHQLGYTDFGENKAQELKAKAQACTLPITWHFIGQLQSNKIRDIVRYASWIHSVDSLRMLNLIDQEAQKQAKTLNILIQVKLTDESTKAGCHKDDLPDLLQHAQNASHLHLKGLMVIGPNTSDQSALHACFNEAAALFNETQKKYPNANELSMGMSQDFDIAAQHQATLFRIGSLIFGRRA